MIIYIRSLSLYILDRLYLYKLDRYAYIHSIIIHIDRLCLYT